MRKRFLAILLLLDGFALGGLAALFLINNLIWTKCCTVGGRMSQTLYNLFDYIFPYTIFFAAMLCVVVILTTVVWFGKSRGTVTDKKGPASG
ncbi:MAG: hypothetical protein HZB51_10760 [Chloroflexi bacterium]|nr:hypothetical protein [Chloroflexota bacterium]